MISLAPNTFIPARQPGHAGHGHGVSPAAQPSARAAAAGRPGETARAEIAGLSEADLAQLRELRARDMEVRAHERAHAAAAGSAARGGPQFTLTRGPDGRMYAIGGEVAIDTSPVPGDPQATLRKAEQIRRAALAPAQPSAQDQAVAAQATAMAMQARAELQSEAAENRGESDSSQTQGAAPPGAAPAPGTAMPASEAPGAACPACGGQHGPGAHAEAVGALLERTYAPARNDSDDRGSRLLASA